MKILILTIFLAHQCPLMGGNAVFHARTLVANFADESYDDAQACLIFGVQLRRTNEFILEIMPNPANSFIELSWNNKDEKDGQVLVFDMIGNLLLSQKISFSDREQ